MGKLDGKVAIVTGAAVGIGRAIAEAFGAEGAQVVVNYSKSLKEAEQTAEMVVSAGGQSLLVQADVSKDDQVRAMVERTLGAFGRIDILVNNAGTTVFVPFTDLEGLSEEAWDRLFAVNVKSMFFCSRAVAPTMKRQGKGCIINLASIAGLTTSGSSIAYCVTKAATVNLTQCLAKALGPEIRVNAIAPGHVEETRWNVGRRDLDTVHDAWIKTAPLHRVGVPSDIAEIAVFLATGASFMTGAVLVADAGRIIA
mgnify:CR=1 FL=1